MSSITWHQPERYWVVQLDDQILGVYDARNREHAIHFCIEDADLLCDGNLDLRDAILSGDIHVFNNDIGRNGELDAIEFKVEAQAAIAKNDTDRALALIDAALHYAPARFGRGASMPPALFRDYHPLVEFLSIVSMSIPDSHNCPACRMAILRSPVPSPAVLVAAGKWVGVCIEDGCTAEVIGDLGIPPRRFCVTITPKTRPNGTTRHFITVWTNDAGPWRAVRQFDFPTRTSAEGVETQREHYLASGYVETPVSQEIALQTAVDQWDREF